MIIQPRAQRRRGIALVESSLGLIILLFVIFGIIEFGQLIMARQLMNNAARSAARAASAGRQPATYPDGTATPSPNGVVDSAFIQTWVNKALAPAPVSAVSLTCYGSNADGSANTGLAWNTAGFGQGFYIDLRASYIPLFSGNRLFADGAGHTGAIAGAIAMRTTVFIRAEANN